MWAGISNKMRSSVVRIACSPSPAAPRNFSGRLQSSAADNRSPSSSASGVHHDHHLPFGLASLHDSMRLADLIEAEDARWFRLQAAGRHLIRNFLERHVRQREARCSEDEASEEGQINSTR